MPRPYDGRDVRGMSGPPTCMESSAEIEIAGLLAEAQREQLRGRIGRSEQCYRSVLAAAPHHALAHTNLAVVLHQLQRSQEALEHARAAVALAADSVDAVRNCAVLLSDLGRWAEAAPYFERWAALDSNNPAAHQMLGDSYARRGLRAQAIPPYAKALTLDPDSVDVANNLGACLAEEGHRAEALAFLVKAVELKPTSPAAWANLGVATKNLGKVETALACFNKTLALDAAHVNALWNRSLCLLALGRLVEGWAEYEWRWKAEGLGPERPFPQPRWDGSDAAGKTILVWPEQGLGDQIAFAGMLPDLLGTGARCVVECEPRLVALFRRSFPGAEVVPFTAMPHPRTQQADIGYQIPAASLARWFRQSLESFPQHHGYLMPDPLRAAQWKERLDRLGDGRKIGICWRSGLAQGMRSMHYAQLNQWGPILATPGVQFVNLQYDQCDEEVREAERQFGTHFHQWDDMDLRNDQEGVAALIAALDLVISAGTAVDQLAGAVGTPAWVLTRGASDWWGLGTDYCPWYPSIRVFRCGAGEPWEPVVEKMAAELVQPRES